MPIRDYRRHIIRNSTGRGGLLSFFFFALVAMSCTGFRKGKADDPKNAGRKPVEYELTVAAIRPASGEDPYIEVTFNESARFYRIPRNATPAYLELLRESEKKHIPVLVKRANEYSDVILRVRKVKQ